MGGAVYGPPQFFPLTAERPQNAAHWVTQDAPPDSYRFRYQEDP